MPQLTVLDYAALSWFVLCWAGYIGLADYTRWRARSISATMGKYRQRWMLMMLSREQRIVDSQIQSMLLHGVAFFASASILLIGGALAMLGATDRAIEIIEDLPFAMETTRVAWEIKVLLLVLILIFAFFKFAWSLRLFNYCSIIIGAAPIDTVLDSEAKAYAKRAGLLNSIAASHFTAGIRAYFFALAALSWFLHPILFMVITGWVTVVLYRREFRSLSCLTLQELEPKTLENE